MQMGACLFRSGYCSVRTLDGSLSSSHIQIQSNNEHLFETKTLRHDPYKLACYGILTRRRTLLVDRKWIRQRWLFRPRSPRLSMQPKTPKKLPRQYETSRSARCQWAQRRTERRGITAMKS